MKKNRIFLVILMLIVCLDLFASYTGFREEHIVNGDVRTLAYSIYPTHDDELFKNDIIARLLQKVSVPLIKGLFYLLTLFMGLPLASKIVGFIIPLITIIYLYKYSKQTFTKKVLALFSLFFMLYIFTFNFFSGGQGRAFTVPLIIAFLYYLRKRKEFIVSIVIVLSALAYPPLSSILIITYILKFIYDLYQKKHSKKATMILLSTCILLLLINIPYLMRNYSESYHLQEAESMKEFSDESFSTAFFSHKPRLIDFSREVGKINFSGFFIIETYLGKIITSSLIILALIFLILFRLKSIKVIPLEIKTLFLSSISLYILALIFFKYFSLNILLFPLLYTKFTFPVILCIFVFKNLDVAIKKVSQKAINTISITLFIGFLAFYIPNFEPDFMQCTHEELYTYLSQTPKDTLIAGHPEMMTCIPLYSKRSVLTSDEATLAIFKDYYNQIKERNDNTFKALYSDNITDIALFCKKHNISLIVLDRYYFNNKYLNNWEEYAEPFKSYVKEINKTRFVLEKYDKPKFNEGNISVISCSDIIESI